MPYPELFTDVSTSEQIKSILMEPAPAEMTLPIFHKKLKDIKVQLGKRGGSYTGPFYKDNIGLIQEIQKAFEEWKKTLNYQQELNSTQQKFFHDYVQYFNSLPESAEKNYFSAKIAQNFKALLHSAGVLLNYPDPTKDGRNHCILHNACATDYPTSHLLVMAKEYADYVMQENHNDDIPLYTALLSNPDIEFIDALLTHHTAWQLTHTNRTFMSAFDLALCLGNVDAAQCLLLYAGHKQLPRCQPSLRAFLTEGSEENKRIALTWLEQAGKTKTPMPTLESVYNFFGKEREEQLEDHHCMLSKARAKRILQEETQKNTVMVKKPYLNRLFSLFSPPKQDKKASSCEPSTLSKNVKEF